MHGCFSKKNKLDILRRVTHLVVSVVCLRGVWIPSESRALRECLFASSTDVCPDF